MTVNALEGLGTIPATGYGLNSAVWDSQMNAPAVQDLLGQAGIGMLRYPGGSYGDIYHWQTNTAPGGYVAPGTDFDSFMGTVKKIGAQPILIANYGTGTPAEAAGWVQYANVTKGYGDKYWEIGNENYGNGYYGCGLGGRQPRRARARRRTRNNVLAVRLGDEGRRSDDQDRRGADPAGQLAGRRGGRR